MGIKLSSKDRKLLTEAESLDSKLLAGGRWACRKDDQAQKELTRISEGSGLADTVQDLHDEIEFWKQHSDVLSNTNITSKDLARADVLIRELGPAVAKEGNDLAASEALELRNRCFWAADELAKDIREGGRYAFHHQSKIAAKFASRYRAALQRRTRRNAPKKQPPQNPPAAPQT